MLQKNKTFRRSLFLLIPLILILLFVIFSGTILSTIGGLIVVDEKPPASDAVVVLNTGIEYYPRLIQAADIYCRGFVRKVIINGNRKTDTLRELEAKGFKRCCPWYENSVRVLAMFGVRQKDILWISAEDAYDTVSEAQILGQELIRRHFTKVILTTSKFHTRRAKFIWKNMYENRLAVSMVSAKTDPYDPINWWKDGRQIRWVLAEYGAWVYYWWKEMAEFSPS